MPDKPKEACVVSYCPLLLLDKSGSLKSFRCTYFENNLRLTCWLNDFFFLKGRASMQLNHIRQVKQLFNWTVIMAGVTNIYIYIYFTKLNSFQFPEATNSLQNMQTFHSKWKNKMANYIFVWFTMTGGRLTSWFLQNSLDSDFFFFWQLHQSITVLLSTLFHSAYEKSIH